LFRVYLGAASAIVLSVLLLALSTGAQTPGSASSAPQNQPQADQQSGQVSSGSISGTVVDPSGAAVAGALVTLARQGDSGNQRITSSESGQFFFPNVEPGLFQLTIAATGFKPQAYSGTLHAGENCAVPQIALALATETTQVRVGPQIAEEQVKQEEKQRVLGVIPNFYVSYIPNPVPLAPKQKFELAWRTSIDPVTFVLTGGIAGVQQAENDFSGYGQGAQGYGKRYGASYADVVIGTFVGSAILPSLLKQDPRYFYKGTGSVRSRALYAVAQAVICKGDNGHWQPNYSGVLGSLAAGGISNLYYPASDRNGAALTFENAAIGIGESAAANLFQEFVIRKLTPSVTKHPPATP
jgi:Carboxypeptidase regulatory-like domain